MVAVVWQLTIHENSTEQFERFYGADGEWTQLSRRSRSFLGSSFLRDLAMPTRYLLVEYLERDAGVREAHRRLRRANQGARGTAQGIHGQRGIARLVLGARRAVARRAHVVPPVGRLKTLKTMMRTGPASRSLAVAAACLLLTLTLSARTAGRAQQASASTPPLSFNRDIRPILSNNCFACHGPDEKQRETKFHFDTREGACSSRTGVIVPGSAAKSLLVKQINEPNPEDRMPPPDSGHALTDKQIALLTPLDRRGRQMGLALVLHGAGPHRTAGRQSRRAGCATRSTSSSRPASNEKACGPRPRPTRSTLLRRVTYDLTGLPPTPAEIDAFLADRSPDAYEKRVDALLASPHYGERMAMPWLDAARYADTHGYHIDSLREMWPWRDWVINAFNRNLPFDRSRSSSSPATCCRTRRSTRRSPPGFNRNHMINFEGGAIAEEYQVEYVIDRVEATSTAFMGLTMGCARCHDHKFDPITHKEFYQFFAFFNNVPEQGLDGRTGNAAPMLPLPSPDAEGAARRAQRGHRRARRGNRRQGRRAAAAGVGERVSPETGAPLDRKRTDGALRVRRQLLGRLRALSSRPHDRRRTDVRRRADRPRRSSTATPRSASATSAPSIAASLHAGGLAEGPGQPADQRLPETGRRAARRATMVLR